MYILPLSSVLFCSGSDVYVQTCEADLGLLGLWPGALGVLERGDRLGELEEDLALDAPPPDPLAAARAAVAPVGHDEAEIRGRPQSGREVVTWQENRARYVLRRWVLNIQ